MSAPDPLYMASHFAGPVQAGAYVNSLFTGIALMQLQVYIRKYRGDSILIRGLVALSCSIMTLNTVLTAFQAYYSTIVRFGDIVATYTLTLPFQISLDTIVLPSSLIQLFFAWRVKRLTGRTWVLAIVATSVIFQWSVTITAISIGNVHTSIQQVLALTGWALSMAIDTLITVNLVIFFNTRKTGYSDTDDFLAMLNRVAIQTGVMISLWNVNIIILESIYPDFTSLILIVAFPPLYVITLLSSLNSRHATDHGNHWSDDTPWTASGTATAPRRATNPGHSHIQVTRTVEQIELDERTGVPVQSPHGPSIPLPASTHPYATSRAFGPAPVTNSRISRLVNVAPREILDGDIDDEESESGKTDLELAGDDVRPNALANRSVVAVPQYDIYDGSQPTDAKGRTM